MIFDGPAEAATVIALAHGAGAAMDTPFMNRIATGLADHGLRVARFEFPYMAQRRIDGKRRGPNTARVLDETWRQVIATLRPAQRLIIGGKSMGGRIASMVAVDEAVDGVICLGYPFHPPAKPEKLRTAHLEAIRVPTLIVQGTRDPFGRPDEVERYGLSSSIEFCWLADGDHSFKPRKSSGFTQDQHLTTAVEAMVQFIG